MNDELKTKINELVKDESSPDKIKLAGEILADIDKVDAEITQKDARITELASAYKKAILNTGYKLDNGQPQDEDEPPVEKSFAEIYQANYNKYKEK